MPRYAYDRLTALDNSFLLLEKPNAYMHVASTLDLRGRPAAPPGRRHRHRRGQAQRDRASLLHRIPRYRQKLAYIPLENHPVWVDDDRFNLDYHVRHTALPRPGTDEQLKRALGAHHAAAPRPHAAALGDVDRRGPRGRPLRADLEGAPLHDRRRLRRRPDERAAVADARRATMPETVAVLPAPGAVGPRAAAPRAAAPRARCRFAALRDVRDFMREAEDARRRDRGAHARRRRDARRVAAPASDDAAQPPDRPAPPLRLDGDGRRRDQGACGARSAAR